MAENVEKMALPGTGYFRVGVQCFLKPCRAGFWGSGDEKQFLFKNIIAFALDILELAEFHLNDQRQPR